MLYKKQMAQSLTHYYAHYIKMVVTIVVIVFIIGSLASYHENDSTFWFYSTALTARHNLFGAAGAQCAALLWYLFGGAASIVVGMLIFYLWLTIQKKAISSECDRWAAFGILLTSLSVLSSLYQHDLIAHITPGGLLGYYAASVFTHWFEASGAFIFAYVLLSIALVLLCNVILFYAWHALLLVLNLVTSRERFWKPVYSVFSFVITLLAHNAQRFSLYIYGILSGGVIKDNYSQLTDTDFEDIFVTDEESSHFWQYYTHSGATPASFNKKEPAPTVEYQPAQTHMRDAKTVPPVAAPHVQKTMQQEQAINSSLPAAAMAPDYTVPTLDIFIGRKEEQDDPALVKELEKRAIILKEKLERFGVYGSVTAIKRGPVVTVFEYQPNIDSKISKIIALEDDLALALQAMSIRIIAPIPGRSVVGFEVANSKCKKVSFAKIITSAVYQKFTGALPLLLGEDTIGADVVVDLARMPHLLIAGSTGSGKSVALNGMLTSLLCRMAPDELRLILIDPKRLEFAPYADIAHLIFPIITDPKKAAPVLRFVIKEMEERYERMSQLNARNIFDYHAATGAINTMPFMVVVIDELADLMMTAGKEIEFLITRITQMARAAGIHMMVATQRPSVDVITGLIKVNFPSRISFRVTSKIDSRTILDCGGADKLLGRGDMLFLDSTSAMIKRVHGAFVSDQEIAKVVDYIRAQQPASYLEIPSEQSKDSVSIDDADDQLYQEVLSFLKTIDEISISLLQRKFRIGFNRSARIIDMLESQGIILPGHGGKTRKIIR